MKPILLTSLFLFLVFSAKSQIGKGAFMAEGGVKLYGTLPSPDGFGVWFGTRDGFNEDYYQSGSDHFSDGSRIFGYSLAPRIGYSLFRNFVVGVDLKYLKYTFSNSPFREEDKGNNQEKGYGFFVRKYLGSKKFTPFVDLEFGFWDSNYFEYSYAPSGGQYEYTDKYNFAYYGGAIGYSYKITERFRLNLMVKLQHAKSTTSNSSTTRELYFDSSMFLSFSYYLKTKAIQ